MDSANPWFCVIKWRYVVITPRGQTTAPCDLSGLFLHCARDVWLAESPQRGEIPADWSSPRRESRPVGPFRFSPSVTQGSAGTAGCALGYRILPRSGLYALCRRIAHGHFSWKSLSATLAAESPKSYDFSYLAAARSRYKKSTRPNGLRCPLEGAVLRRSAARRFGFARTGSGARCRSGGRCRRRGRGSALRRGSDRAVGVRRHRSSGAATADGASARRASPAVSAVVPAASSTPAAARPAA